MSTESTKFTIGGQEVSVPALNFLGLENCWDNIVALGSDTRAVGRTAHMLRIVSWGLHCHDDGTEEQIKLKVEDRFQALRRQLMPWEMSGLDASVVGLFKNSGLNRQKDDPEPGEARPALAESGAGTTL